MSCNTPQERKTPKKINRLLFLYMQAGMHVPMHSVGNNCNFVIHCNNSYICFTIKFHHTKVRFTEPKLCWLELNSWQHSWDFRKIGPSSRTLFLVIRDVKFMNQGLDASIRNVPVSTHASFYCNHGDLETTNESHCYEALLSFTELLRAWGLSDDK